MQTPVPVRLEGTHVRLEPLHENHLPGLEAAGAYDEIWPWIQVRKPEPRDSVRNWHTRALAAGARGEMVPFATVSRATGTVVGGTTFLDIGVADCRLEIGFTWLTPSVWRSAINTECKLLLLRHAFETLGANRVQLKTDSRNVRSQTAIARLGATREGVLRHHMVMPDGYLRDTVMFSIIKPEWPTVRVRLESLLAQPRG